MDKNIWEDENGRIKDVLTDEEAKAFKNAINAHLDAMEIPYTEPTKEEIEAVRKFNGL